MSKTFNQWLELAYLAGILDGEGWLGATSSAKRQTKGLRIECNMTDKDVLERLQVTFGGTIRPTLSPSCVNKKRKPIWRWTARTAQARSVLNKIRPFVGKRRAARIKQLLSGDYRTIAETLAALNL